MTITPTYGIQVNAVNVTAGGAYPAGTPPTVAFGGTTPIGGAPSAVAETLSGAAIPRARNSAFHSLWWKWKRVRRQPGLDHRRASLYSGARLVPATGTASISTDYGVVSVDVTVRVPVIRRRKQPTVSISGGGG